MTLICLGDSLTFGYGVPRNRCWTSLAQKDSGFRIVNMGISGDTTGGMLTRLNTKILNDQCFQRFRENQPRVLLMGGTNDIFYSGSSMAARSNIGAMVHQLRTRGSEPLVGIAPTPVLDRVPQNWAGILTAETPAEIAAYTEWLCRWCAAFSVQTIDFRPLFLTENGLPDADAYLDGLHPNQEGHARMAAKLANWMKES